MRTTFFHAVPAMRCHCPAKTFRKASQALEYARQAANAFKVAYAVWRVRKGTLRLLIHAPGGRVRFQAGNSGGNRLQTRADRTASPGACMRRYPPSHVRERA
jgi:hypothetical protein